MILRLEEFANWGLDSFDETVPALPYREVPGVLGDDGE